MLKITQITINRLKNPQLVDPLASPRFGWRFFSDQTDAFQTAFQLEIFSGEDKIFDTGRKDTDQSVDNIFHELSLAYQTHYTLSLTLWDNHGQVAKGETHFATALDQEGWQ